MLESQSFKGSKDADFGLVSEKILSHNNGPTALDDAIGAIKKVLDDHAPLKKRLELKEDWPKNLG